MGQGDYEKIKEDNGKDRSTLSINLLKRKRIRVKLENIDKN